ncbi:MAG: hypothetical protein PHH77_04445 [Victivallaceae bacterium]|nr:hypothetical protein [Victivallaceae bacterium]
MSNHQLKKLESVARHGFLTQAGFIPPAGWQDEVIADIRRRAHAEKFAGNLKSLPLLPLRLVWRLAAVSVTVAVLVCLTLYLAVPESAVNDNLTNEVAVDNFDNYLQIAARL